MLPESLIKKSENDVVRFEMEVMTAVSKLVKTVCQNFLQGRQLKDNRDRETLRVAVGDILKETFNRILVHYDVLIEDEWILFKN
ncbi:MAG: hypothetical protein AB7D02_03395 [Candidatus Paceibacterota bacterium]